MWERLSGVTSELVERTLPFNAFGGLSLRYRLCLLFTACELEGSMFFDDGMRVIDTKFFDCDLIEPM